jgi:hypothetical protein
VLPDVVLLQIFDFYLDEARIDAWYTLVHVCGTWRSIVFGSPRRLDLRLQCKVRTPVRKMLDVWPPLPIAIWGNVSVRSCVDNIVAALELKDRISTITLLAIPSSQFEKVFGIMQQPFPALTGLDLMCEERAPIVPTSFLGGSAPHLRTLILFCFPFPGLPTLLLCATHLVDLKLQRIPHSGYISPDAMVAGLSVLTSLETLHIGFESPQGHPDRKRQRLPSPTRILLPVLTELRFGGAGEYLEDLVAQIDAPLLDTLDITFFPQPTFDTLALVSPQLTQFLSRVPKFKAHDEALAHVIFSDWEISVTLPQTPNGRIHFKILCSQPDLQLSSLAQVCSSYFPLPLISAVEHLYIQSGVSGPGPRLHWVNDTTIESSQWLELLRPFSSVKSLYICKKFTPHIVIALQEIVGEGVTEVLPALETLFLEEPLPSGPVRNTIEQLVVARHLASHPIAGSHLKSLPRFGVL